MSVDKFFDKISIFKDNIRVGKEMIDSIYTKFDQIE